MVQSFSVEISKPTKDNEGAVRRCTLSPNELLSIPEAGIETIYDVMERSARLFPNQNGLGWRDTIKVHDVEKEVTKKVDGKEVKEMKTWKYFEMSDYKYHTYSEVATSAKQLGAGLKHLGLSNSTNFNIFSSTSPRWLTMALACISQSITFCTSYDSLGPEGLKHSLNEPEVVGMFTNADLLSTVAGAIGSCKTVKVVVYDGELTDKTRELKSKIENTREDIKVLSMDELKALGTEHPAEPTKPKPDDMACIMYTSGSTGTPKGVIITHKQVIASVAGVTVLLADFIVPGESYIAYLPLAHILEFVVEMCMFFVGVPMGYGNVKTLTDTSMKNCVGDIRAFQPTIMCGVPAVWELIRKGIQSKVKAGGAVKQKVFNGAMAAKTFSKTLFGGVTDAVVFKQVKQATGGKLKYALSGGAPISQSTQQFLMTCLVTTIQGYGLTESCGMCAILPPSYPRYHTVGVPVPSIEVKLVDVPDAGYKTTNTPSQGEVYIRGGSVTVGYYKREDLTKEAFTEDGWFMTGDIGQWNEDGTLSIIDRKKNLVKLSGGEYIALEKLESVYKASPIVSNIMVHADSNAKQPMAIISCHENNLKDLAGKKDDFESLTKDPAVKKAALDQLNETGRKAGFKQMELLSDVVLTHEEWTPQSGLLTAAQKLQRKQVQEHYKDAIKKTGYGQDN